MYSVVVTDHPNLDRDRVRQALDGAADVTVATLDTAEDLIAAARSADADAAVVDVDSAVPARVADETDLRVVASASVGLSGIDVPGLAERGVAVTHVPDYCTEEVATHALALLLAGVRSIPAYDRSVRDGEWSWGATRELHRLHGATVGLVSFGPIARRFADRLSGFDCTVLASDPYVDAATMADHGVERVDFGTLVERADHLSVHAPLTPDTRGMVDAEAFAALSDHAVIVNTGRGPVIDADDLLAALEAGEVGAAALDVLETEPPEDDPLVGREDTVVTPHAGFYSVEARTDLATAVATDLLAVLDGDEPEGLVDPDADWL